MNLESKSLIRARGLMIIREVQSQTSAIVAVLVVVLSDVVKYKTGK